RARRGSRAGASAGAAPDDAVGASLPQPAASAIAKSTPAARRAAIPSPRGPARTPRGARSPRPAPARRALVSDATSSSTSAPIYADRSSGENLPDATRMVNAYLTRFSQRTALQDGEGAPLVPVLDEGGYAEVQRGSAIIGINVLEQQGVLMVFSP